MRQASLLKMAWILVVSLMLTGSGIAAPAPAPDQDIVGDWKLERTGVAEGQNIRMFSSILSLSRDKEGKLTGQMISFMGISDLTDVTYQDGTLSFSQTSQRRDQTTVTKFTGTFKDGKLTGTQTSQRGDVKMEATRIPTPPAIVGDWQIVSTRGDRQMTTLLSVTTDKDGKLAATWETQRPESDRPAQQDQQNAQQTERQRPRGPVELSDVQYKDGTLTFSRRFSGRSRSQDQNQQQQQQERVMQYSFTAKGDTLTGTMTTPDGDRAIEGKRVVKPAVGKWLLTMTSQRGERTQQLVINPDMSGRYGSMPVEKITVEDNAVSFTLTMGFGDRTFETSFKGTLEADQLTGQLVTKMSEDQQYTQEVVGKKM